MRTYKTTLVLPFVLMLLLLVVGFGANDKKQQPSVAVQSDKADKGTTPVVTEARASSPSDTVDAVVSQAMTAGVTSASSASYSIVAGAGQTAVGESNSPSYGASGGLQEFPEVLSGESGCCIGMTGNVDNDVGHIVDIGDLTALISYLFIPPNPVPVCFEEANVDGDEGCIVDIGDLTALIAYLFIPPNPLPADCP